MARTLCLVQGHIVTSLIDVVDIGIVRLEALLPAAHSLVLLILGRLQTGSRLLRGSFSPLARWPLRPRWLLVAAWPHLRLLRCTSPALLLAAALLAARWLYSNSLLAYTLSLVDVRVTQVYIRLCRQADATILLVSIIKGLWNMMTAKPLPLLNSDSIILLLNHLELHLSCLQLDHEAVHCIWIFHLLQDVAFYFLL